MSHIYLVSPTHPQMIFICFFADLVFCELNQIKDGSFWLIIKAPFKKYFSRDDFIEFARKSSSVKVGGRNSSFAMLICSYVISYGHRKQQHSFKMFIAEYSDSLIKLVNEVLL